MKKSNGWSKVSADEIIAAFGSDKDSGLGEKKVKENKRRWGMNSLWYYGGAFMFLKSESIFSVIGYVILVISAFTASVFDICKDAGIIGAAIITGLIVLFGFEVFAGIICSRHCEKWIPHSTVIRCGRPMRIRGDHIVPGDIVILKKGDFITADMKLIFADGLSVKEPSFFKAADPVEKNAIGNMPSTDDQHKLDDCLYAGSEILSGFGKAVVAAVGTNTVLGSKDKIRLTSDTDPVHLTLSRKNGVSIGTAFMILAFVAVSIGVFSPLTATDFVGLFLIFLSFAVSAGGEIYPSLCSVMYTLAVSRAEEHGVIIRDATGADFIMSCKGVAAENSSIMKSGCVDLKMVYSDGKNCAFDGAEAHELLALLYTGIGHGKGKYSHEITGAIKEHLSSYDGFDPFESDVTATKQLVDHISSGRLQYSLFTSETDHYFTMVGSIDDVIGHCTKVRLNGKDELMTKDSLESILRAASNATKNAMHLIAIAVRNSPYITMNRLSVLTADLTFIGFIAVDAPADPSIQGDLAYLKQENIPFFFFSDGSGEDVNFARRIGVINSREDLVSAKEPAIAVANMMSGTLVGGVVEAETTEDIISVLETARKDGHRIVSVGSSESLKGCGFTAVIGEPSSGSGALVNPKGRSEISAFLRVVRALRSLSSRFSAVRKYIFISTILRAVYCITVLLGSAYVFPSAVLIWGILIDVLVSLLILSIRPSARRE